MIATIVGLAFAAQVAVGPPSTGSDMPLVERVQYRVPVHPPPCGRGWDLSAAAKMKLVNSEFFSAMAGASTLVMFCGPRSRGQLLKSPCRRSQRQAGAFWFRASPINTIAIVG